MDKFIGLKTKDETSAIISLETVARLHVEADMVIFKDGKHLILNEPSTKVLLDILMENEYKGANEI